MSAVIVPLDGSEEALVALPIATRVAETAGGPLNVVHVAHEHLPPAAVLERVHLTPGELRGSVLSTATGEPTAGIVQTARDRNAAFIVMCPRTGADVGTTLGRTARAVVERAPCPVVLGRLERGVVPWELHRILLPHDGTAVTSAALRPAMGLARTAHAELHLLHAAAPGARQPAEHGSLVTPRYVDQAHHEWPAWQQEFLERLTCECPLDPLPVRMFLGRGAPAEEVLRVAAEQAIDLIVLAWRGSWDADRAMVVKTVVRRAPCPVMIVRANQEKEEGQVLPLS